MYSKEYWGGTALGKSFTLIASQFHTYQKVLGTKENFIADIKDYKYLVMTINGGSQYESVCVIYNVDDIIMALDAFADKNGSSGYPFKEIYFNGRSYGNYFITLSYNTDIGVYFNGINSCTVYLYGVK